MKLHYWEVMESFQHWRPAWLCFSRVGSFKYWRLTSWKGIWLSGRHRHAFIFTCFQALWNPQVSKCGCSLESPGEFVKIQIPIQWVYSEPGYLHFNNHSRCSMWWRPLFQTRYLYNWGSDDPTVSLPHWSPSIYYTWTVLAKKMSTLQILYSEPMKQKLWYLRPVSWVSP